MTGLRTEYEFVLPRGYLDESGSLHKRGVMRLATARDELEPLRDPTIQSPEDPRLTIIVLARVVTRLGTMDLVTPHEIEGLFAADLAYLQDFYGVINFGSDDDIQQLLAEQAALSTPPAPRDEAPPPTPSSAVAAPPGPSSLDVERPFGGRRNAIEEVPAARR